MSVIYEIDYDLRGEAGERRQDYTTLDERISLLGDALRIEYSSWFVEASASLPMVEAYLKKTLRSNDRCRFVDYSYSNIASSRYWLEVGPDQLLSRWFQRPSPEDFECRNWPEFDLSANGSKPRWSRYSPPKSA